MREIKFRGWHTEKKVMFSAEEMAVDQLTLLPTGQFINVSGASTRLSEIYPSDKFIPLQYTGLKDKNGKEIYEGDIIQDENGTAEVVFHRAGFLNKPHNAPPYLITIWEECEVIGNIYSNSELLEVKDGPSGK